MTVQFCAISGDGEGVIVTEVMVIEVMMMEVIEGPDCSVSLLYLYYTALYYLLLLAPVSESHRRQEAENYYKKLCWYFLQLYPGGNFTIIGDAFIQLGEVGGVAMNEGSYLR